MKSLVMPAPGELELVERPEPEMQLGCAKIRMEYCGICGSDLTAYKGVNPTVRYPIDGIGHEGIGVIEEIGENDRGLKVGDRVAMEPYIPCRKCHMCAVGRFNNCADIHVAGVHTKGVMSGHIVFPVDLLYRVPDGLDPLDAALTEPLTIGLHAAARAEVKAGEYCLVSGAGPIGLLAALGVKSKGATPILLDVVQERLDFARSCGIEHTVLGGDDLPERLKAITGGLLPQAMLECTGSPAVIGAMTEYVCHGARIALVGWPKGPVTVNTVRCIQKELDLKPSRNSNAQFPTALKLIAEGKIPTRKIITRVVRAEEAKQTMLDMMAHPGDYMKVVVRLDHMED